MIFQCLCELRISGAEAPRRLEALKLFALGDFGGAPLEEEDAFEAADGSLRARFVCVDEIPEDAVDRLAGEYPDLSFLLLYHSQDGEFCGLREARGSTIREASLDLESAELKALKAMDETRTLDWIAERLAQL